MKLLLSVLLALATVGTIYSERLHFLSDDFINSINSKQTTWKAGSNFDVNSTTIWQIKRLLGVHPDSDKYNLPPKKFTALRDDLPATFDAREQWPDCNSIKLIRDQANCGSCWAVAATSAMSDRICITTEGANQVLLSSRDLMSCCLLVCGFGCQGGIVPTAWWYWVLNGLVSGGEYGSTDGCVSYPFPPCGGENQEDCDGTQATPECVRQCDEGSTLSYDNDIHFGQESYSFNNEEEMRQEIIANGPIEATFYVMEDFLNYKSGVYEHTEGAYLGGHAVKIIGWGEEGGTPYWLVSNSWNTDWGDNGLFKIIRGVNNCDIERGAHAGIPKIN